MKEKITYGLTDEQVETEIAMLNESEDVELARHEQRLKYRRRQYLYVLRSLEKRGKELKKQGMTKQKLDRLYKNEDEEDE